ncbi:OsmC family protein [Sphingomonas sp.]|uniref:OsmC family protein n=1 Tax=Sphingomonas sp. TaxID=28214 RepID=UPI001B0D205C|nr:OsmC family protein [Sphingomonas sp.]MBO9712300.1 OsmC family protein [Sphingomonas sp.]
MAEEALRPGEVVARPGEGKFGTRIEASGHGWVMDEPVPYGGLDAGPTPYDALLAALGSCTSMTVRLVARQESIPLESITVRLRHDRNHARDCAQYVEAGTRLEAIYRTITLEGPLSEAQRKRLMDVADKCPVHRTLTGILHIHTEEAAAG